jgi:hypothetical protein
MEPTGSHSLSAVQLPDRTDGVPNVSRAEEVVAQALPGSEWPPLPGTRESGDPFAGIRAAWAIALHAHQPPIPAVWRSCTPPSPIGNLQYMLEHPDLGENHNIRVFRRATAIAWSIAVCERGARARGF